MPLYVCAKYVQYHPADPLFIFLQMTGLFRYEHMRHYHSRDREVIRLHATTSAYLRLRSLVDNLITDKHFRSAPLRLTFAIWPRAAES